MKTIINTIKNLSVVVLSLVILIALASFAYAIGDATASPATNILAPSNFTAWYRTNYTDVTAGGTLADKNGINRSDKGGYIHVMDINETAQSKNWVGYVGNVNGELALADSNGYQLYDWNMAIISGEIYAILERGTSRGEAPYWPELSCANKSLINELSQELNHTANQVNNVWAEDRFNDTWSWDDTYKDFKVANISFDSDQGGTDSGFAIDTNNQTFGVSAGALDSCPNINLMNGSYTAGSEDHDNTRDGINNTDGAWDEVVLVYYDDNGVSDAGANKWPVVDYIFVGIMDNNQAGFNTSAFDYQLVLPALAASVNESSPINLEYTFYVELG